MIQEKFVEARNIKEIPMLLITIDTEKVLSSASMG